MAGRDVNASEGKSLDVEQTQQVSPFHGPPSGPLDSDHVTIPSITCLQSVNTLQFYIQHADLPPFPRAMPAGGLLGLYLLVLKAGSHCVALAGPCLWRAGTLGMSPNASCSVLTL